MPLCGMRFPSSSLGAARTFVLGVDDDLLLVQQQRDGVSHSAYAEVAEEHVHGKAWLWQRPRRRTPKFDAVRPDAVPDQYTSGRRRWNCASCTRGGPRGRP